MQITFSETLLSSPLCLFVLHCVLQRISCFSSCLFVSLCNCTIALDGLSPQTSFSFFSARQVKKPKEERRKEKCWFFLVLVPSSLLRTSVSFGPLDNTELQNMTFCNGRRGKKRASKSPTQKEKKTWWGVFCIFSPTRAYWVESIGHSRSPDQWSLQGGPSWKRMGSSTVDWRETGGRGMC